MPTILTDKRKVHSLSHDDYYAEVGEHGIASMEVYAEHGSVEMVPAVAIYYTMDKPDQPRARIILGPGWRVDYGKEVSSQSLLPLSYKDEDTKALGPQGKEVLDSIEDKDLEEESLNEYFHRRVDAFRSTT